MRDSQKSIKEYFKNMEHVAGHIGRLLSKKIWAEGLAKDIGHGLVDLSKNWNEVFPEVGQTYRNILVVPTNYKPPISYNEWASFIKDGFMARLTQEARPKKDQKFKCINGYIVENFQDGIKMIIENGIKSMSPEDKKFVLGLARDEQGNKIAHELARLDYFIEDREVLEFENNQGVKVFDLYDESKPGVLEKIATLVPEHVFSQSRIEACDELAQKLFPHVRDVKIVSDWKKEGTKYFSEFKIDGKNGKEIIRACIEFEEDSKEINDWEFAGKDGVVHSKEPSGLSMS